MKKVVLTLLNVFILSSTCYASGWTAIDRENDTSSMCYDSYSEAIASLEGRDGYVLKCSEDPETSAPEIDEIPNYVNYPEDKPYEEIPNYEEE